MRLVCANYSCWIFRFTTSRIRRYSQCISCWFNGDSCSWSNQVYGGRNGGGENSCDTIQCDLRGNTTDGDFSFKCRNLNFGTENLGEFQSGSGARVGQISGFCNWKVRGGFSVLITRTFSFISTFDGKLSWIKIWMSVIRILQGTDLYKTFWRTNGGEKKIIDGCLFATFQCSLNISLKR